MIFIFPIFAFSECQLKQTMSEEYGRILNITNFVDCTNSDPFEEYETVSAVSYSKTDTSFVNTNMSSFSHFNNVNTVMFEGIVQSIQDYPMNFKNLKKVIFYRNLYNIEMFAFDINIPPILHYYGSVVPKYNFGTFSKVYSRIEIHVSDIFSNDTFLGLPIIRDLSSGSDPSSTSQFTSTTSSSEYSTSSSDASITSPSPTLSTTSDSSTTSSTSNSQSDIDNGESDETKTTTVIIVVSSILLVLIIIAIIAFLIYRIKHSKSEVLSNINNINNVETLLTQNQSL